MVEARDDLNLGKADVILVMHANFKHLDVKQKFHLMGRDLGSDLTLRSRREPSCCGIVRAP
jgi:hypothetical protein